MVAPSSAKGSRFLTRGKLVSLHSKTAGIDTVVYLIRLVRALNVLAVLVLVVARGGSGVGCHSDKEMQPDGERCHVIKVHSAPEDSLGWVALGGRVGEKRR